MRHLLIAPLVALALSVPALPAHAACYADYKAKQDAPLRLHYGVAEIRGACTKQNAAREIAPRLAKDGWTLLTILSTFDSAKLDEKRARAGDYFLRY